MADCCGAVGGVTRWRPEQRVVALVHLDLSPARVEVAAHRCLLQAVSKRSVALWVVLREHLVRADEHYHEVRHVVQLQCLLDQPRVRADLPHVLAVDVAEGVLVLHHLSRVLAALHLNHCDLRCSRVPNDEDISLALDEDTLRLATNGVRHDASNLLALHDREAPGERTHVAERTHVLVWLGQLLAQGYSELDRLRLALIRVITCALAVH